ncbi:MAG: hypothetical protein CMG00_03105 [Candidatus Marinimicrobia bacterium]|nr:hypothetical protein [Candidatus Neomarinimicrobiota bacterium]|tara:strand:+ start:6971 stop:7534 length:564 start_codon:yes stop_codon:yes gene_type:complete
MDYQKPISKIYSYKNVSIIAKSNNFQVELIKKISSSDLKDLVKTSKDLVEVFGEDAILNNNNINKYFNEKTLPFIARYNKTIIGYIIGVPLEKFNNESWAHFDINLNKFNTLYTYAFVIQKKFRKKTGYSKTLKKIYINWAKKRGFKYITGHVKKQVSEKFKNTEIIKTFNVWYDCNEPFNYYRRKI